MGKFEEIENIERVIDEVDFLKTMKISRLEFETERRIK